MSEFETRAVKFDAQTNVAHLVLRELRRARYGLQTFPEGARHLYEQTRIELLVELTARLVELLGRETVEQVDAEAAKEAPQ